MGFFIKLANIVYSADELKKDADAEAAAALAAENGSEEATAAAAPSEITLQV